MSELKKFTVDPAAAQMLELAQSKGIFTAFDRAQVQKPHCGFGSSGVCCKICLQGPCRIMPKKEGGSQGICGARDYTIVARNAARMMSGGASAHSDHARHITMGLLHAAEGNAPDYKITDPVKLHKVAQRVGVSTEGKSDNELAKEVAMLALKDYERLSGFGDATWTTSTMIESRNAILKATGTMPSSINAAIVEQLHQTHVGMDADPVSIIFGGLKAAIGDLAGEYIGTDLSDVLFGTPKPVVSEANMGVIKEKNVNLVVHGHNPILSEIIVQAAREMEDEAKAAGADKIQCMGICCTGNEVLMRQGVPIVTSFGSQELALMTGAVDAAVVDVQCIMPGLEAMSKCFNTKLITTSEIAKIPGAYHVYFNEEHAMEDARAVVRLAIQGFKERAGKEVNIPAIKNKVVAGFSVEALMEIFGAVNTENPISVLTDAILDGEIKGVAMLIGCNNLRGAQDENHIAVLTEMLKNDVFVVTTGCAAQAYAKMGFMNGEAIEKYAGPGLKSFLGRLEKANEGKLIDKLPAVFHMGSCVDNSRCFALMSLMAEALGEDTKRVPFVASAPEAMSEKAVAIGSWLVTTGVPTHVGANLPVHGSPLVHGVVTKIAEDVFGGYLILEEDPIKGAEKLIAKLDERAWRLRVRKGYQAKLSESDLAGK